MTAPPRRALLRWAGLGAAAPALAQVRPDAAAAVAVRTEGRWAFFAEREASFVRAAVDRLLPADGFPSAGEAGVVEYIDRQLDGPFGRGERLYLAGPFERGTPRQGYQLQLTPAQLYREAIAGLEPHLGGRPFEARPPAEQDAFLSRLEENGLSLGTVPSGVFFETLLANTIEGFFADPAYGGNRDMAGWRMIGFPGAYAQFVQWVDQHGVRFERPPMSIGTGAGHGHGHGHGHGGEPPYGRAPARR